MATVEELQVQINTLLGQLAALPIENEEAIPCASTRQESSKHSKLSDIKDSAQKLQDFDFDDLKRRLDKQEDHNKSIIIGVLIAFILIVFSTSITVILSYKNESSFIREIEQEIYNQKLQYFELNKKFENFEEKYIEKNK